MAIESLLILFGILFLSCAARFIPRPTARQVLLLGCSYFIYAEWAGKRFLLVLIASSLMNYLLGSVLRRRPTTTMLWTGIGLNIFLLAIFKYLPPLANQWPGALGELDFLRRIILPLGISFWTFQGLSYLMDIYLEKELDPSLVEFCLYMAFWPSVVAGPVCRLPKMLPQFRQLSSSVREDFSVGLVRLVQGLFMKLVLAQLLVSGLTPGAGVAAGFDATTSGWSGLDVWALALGYAFQMFFDFAGYSNMAIGAARLLGFRLPENFDRPYLSITPSIFWTRWHMSLSFWIRDYVYSPLATIRRVTWWPYAALFISMVIFGFWHEAKITYVVWGIYHGTLLVGHRLGVRLKQRIPFRLPRPLGPLLSWGITFLLVTLGYILFRANNLHQALEMLQAVVRPGSYQSGSAILPPDYYRLVSSVVIGYFVYVGSAQLLALWATSYRDKLRDKTASLPTMRMPGWATFSRAVLMVEGGLAERKWWCLTPALVLLLMIATLSFLGQSSNLAPFLYTLF